MKKTTGYQYLDFHFFDVIEKRKLPSLAIFLYVYLRGLYCKFQNPEFYHNDQKICRHLNISYKTLQRMRCCLQEKGLIEYKSGFGNSQTSYKLLGTTLLPSIGSGQIVHTPRQIVHTPQSNSPLPYIRVKNKAIKEKSNSNHISKKEAKEILKNLGIKVKSI